MQPSLLIIRCSVHSALYILVPKRQAVDTPGALVSCAKKAGNHRHHLQVQLIVRACVQEWDPDVVLSDMIIPSGAPCCIPSSTVTG